MIYLSKGKREIIGERNLKYIQAFAILALS